VAYSWGRANLKAGDLVVYTEMEHHSNLVPWQMLAAERGIDVKAVPVTDDGELDRTVLTQLLAREPKLLCVTHMSNVPGTLNPNPEHAPQAPPPRAPWRGDGAQARVLDERRLAQRARGAPAGHRGRPGHAAGAARRTT